MPDTVKSAYLFEVYIFQRFSGIDFINRTEDGFHYTTCCTENNAGTGRLTHRVVKRAVQYQREADIGAFNQSCQFAGGNRIIYVGNTVHFKFIAGTLVLLCQTGHDGYDYQLFSGNSHLFRPIGFGDRAEHLLR